MKIRAACFNFNLFLSVLLFFTACQSNKEPGKTKKQKKELSTLLFHLETAPSLSDANVVPIYRQSPVLISVDSAPFLDSTSVTNAAVVPYMDGFAIQVQFDNHGRFVLDTVTTANRGKRIAIEGIFPERRWLAAPMIPKGNPTGVFLFTPDASREEAERIVRGLNTVAKDIRMRQRF